MIKDDHVEHSKPDLIASNTRVKHSGYIKTSSSTQNFTQQCGRATVAKSASVNFWNVTSRAF
jgi:hypothetical protein